MPGKYKRPIHLALGGGGARALAHIGVLNVIERERLPIRRMSGTSGGAVIAALYAQTGDARQVYDRMRAFLQSEAFRAFGLDLFSNSTEEKRSYWDRVENLIHYLRSRLVYTRVLMAESIFPSEQFIEVLHELFDDTNLEDGLYPLQIAAVNVDNGEDVLLSRGNLIRAVAASSAIPGLISPVEFEGMRLIDGAVLNAVPLICTDKHREVVVGVDVSRCVRAEYPQRLAIDYIFRAEEITTHRLNQVHLGKAEVLIRPHEVRHGHWADFSRLDEFIASGEQAAQQRVPDLRRAMQHQDSPLKRWLRHRLCDET
ncbi:MAG: hypothetical protein D6743_01725 [Calditrichaeota bacterium]|nr:MAG: hypothetical protein D6743_01725 [Calditrichota bacterium]